MAEREYKIDKRGDPGLQGRVSGMRNSETHIRREKSLLKALGVEASSKSSDEGLEIPKADASDNYSGKPRFEDNGKVLSTENIAAYEEGVSDYRAGKEITGADGIVPCDLTRRPRKKSRGRSGKRTWDR